MSTTSAVSGLSLPEQEDILNPEDMFGNYALGADSLLIPRFSTTADRDTAFSAGVSEGMFCSLAQQPQVYDGTSWWMLENFQHGVSTAASSLTNTSSFAQPTGLFVDFLTPGNYIMETVFFLTNSTPTNGQGIRRRWDVISGTFTGNIGRCTFQNSTASGTGVNAWTSMQGALSTLVLSVAGSTAQPTAHLERMTVQCSTAGRLQFGWQPSAVTPNTITVSAGSHINLRRIS